MRRLFPIFLGLFFSQCNPCHEPSDKPLIALPQNVKDYGVFEVGTYWVYQNDSTLQTDSMAVESTHNDTLPISNHCEVGFREQAYVDLSSTLLGGSYSLVSQSDQVILISSTSDQPEIFYSWQNADSLSNHLLDSLEVGGNTYYDIFTGSNQYGSTTDYLSARHFGIIKKLIYSPSGYVESWSLIRSHIIQ
jgi:hypothetical protein